MRKSVVYYADPTAADQGAAGTRTIKGLMTAIGSTKQATIVLAHTSSSTNTTYTVSTDLTVSSNITVKVDRGALVAPATGKTLTIDGPFEAGLYQVFDCDGTGSVVFGGGSVSEVYPEWWGIGSSDDAVPINRAIAALANGGVVQLQGTTYTIASKITPLNNVTIRGVGHATIISETADFGDNSAFRAWTQQTGVVIEDLKIDGSNNATGTTYAHGITLDDSLRSAVRNVYIYAVKGDGIYIGNHYATDAVQATDIIIENNIIRDVARNGISDIGGQRHIIKNNIIETPALNGLDIEPDSNVPIKDILITGNLIYSPTSKGIVVAYSNVTTAANKERLIVSNNIINKTGSFGILADDVYNATFSGNEIYDAGGVGIYTDLGSTLIKIDNNRIIIPAQECIKVGAGSVDVINNYVLADAANAMYIGIENGMVTNNHITSVGEYHGIYMTSLPTDVIVANNYINGTTPGTANWGIYDDGSERAMIVNNRIEQYAVGIKLGTAVADTTYLGYNHVNNNTRTVIDERSVTGTVTLSTFGTTTLNAKTTGVTATLPDGQFIGQQKIITASDVAPAVTLSVTHHETSNPETFTFSGVGNTLILQWTGTVWVTIHNFGVTVP